MFRTSMKKAVSGRFFSTSPMVLNKQSKVAKHVDFLKQFYTPELLQSIQITETLVSPKDMLKIQKKGLNARSRVSPTNETLDYSTNDAKWDESIVFPNQSEDKTAYPPIPQIQNPDNTHLKLRIRSATQEAKHRDARVNIALELSKLTGLDGAYIKKLYHRPIIMKRVSCQTAKGKIPNFYVLTVVGNKNGMIGLGEGKSRDGIRTALVKAHWNAVKNLTPITRYDNRTIIGDIEYKYHAVKLFIKSAPAGFGLRVNPNIFEVCQAAGIKDLGGKVYKSRNPMNVVKGFVEALTKQRSLEDLAAGRGKKLVDLRKVYYSA